MTDSPSTKSYVIPCSSAFRDAVQALASRRGVSAADLVRGILLLVDPAVLATWPDPGGPGREDREVVVVQSGQSANRELRRKPRLQVRLPEGIPVETIRRALGLMLTLDRGDRSLRLEDPEAVQAENRRAEKAEQEASLLREMVEQLLFQPLDHGIRSRSDALHVLGFPPHSRPDPQEVRDIYRSKAKIYHPDSRFGDNLRMSQLTDAMRVLRTGGL